MAESDQHTEEPMDLTPEDKTENEDMTDEDDPMIRLSDPLVEVSKPDDEPMLFSALRCNDVMKVENQIERGFDINHRKTGEAYRVNSPTVSLRVQTRLYTPLHVAVLHSPIKTITLLLDRGAGVDIVDEQMRSPLHFAVIANRVRVVKLLIDRGAQLNLQSSSGRSPLLQAVTSEMDECARLLVQCGADLDLCDLKGSSALHHLCFGRQPNMYLIKLLLEKGATVDITNKKGATPLMFAANMKRIPLVQLLLDYGANINHRDSQNFSAIHLCSTVQRRLVPREPNIMLFLIHHGAQVNLSDKTGKTMLDKAIMARSLSTIKILLQADCPRDAAAIMNHPSMLYLFDIVPEFQEWMIRELNTPRSLMRLCRGQIRDSLTCDNVLKALKSLDLPLPMQNFVLFRDVSPSTLV